MAEICVLSVSSGAVNVINAQ